MLCSRREWLLVGVLAVAFQQTITQDIHQLVDNPSINAGSDVSLQVTAATADLAAGTWYLFVSPNPVRQLPNNDRTRYSVSGLFHRLTISNVVASDEGLYYYVHGQGVVTQGLVTVATQAAFSTWTAWTNSSCAVTCGTSETRFTSRTRTCLAGSGQCNGATFESRLINCQLNQCPINGGVSLWGSWSPPTCTQTCGVGATGPSVRTRACSNPSPANGGLFCSPPLSETSMRPCNLPACTAAFSSWTAWTNTSCAVTCGTAVTRFTSRTRTCLAGSGQCNGGTFESRLINCQLNQCPIDGGFSMWGFWQTSACPVTCGTSATKLRTRSRLCSNPAPQFGGRNCTGPFAETQTVNCNLTACQSVAMLESNPQTYIGATISLQVPVPGPTQVLGAWFKRSEGVFSAVTATARTVLSVDGNIHQLTLINVTAEDAGTYFYFVAGTNNQGDLTIRPPVHGGISPWGPWNNPTCPVTCGQGVRTLSRSRTCTQPVPQFGGRTCSEANEETMRITCTLANCPIDGGYSPWNQWSNPPCSGSCGNLSKVVSRVRTCSNPPPQFGGRQCVGSRTQTATRSCNLAACTGCPEATIYFVVDQSESVGTANFQLLKAALNSFVSSIISRNNNIRVGVIGFSSNVTSFIRDTSDISSLQASINFTLTPPNGGTNTHLGIRTATQSLNQGTSNYPKVMVVITDGLSNLPNETRVAAAEARNSGITVFAVGVNAFNIPSIRQRFQAELLSIASSNATAIESANFNVLTNSLNNISQILCRGTVNGNWGSWGPWSVTRCSGTCGTSIVGTSNRTRTCTDPAPFLNGNSCVGNSIEVIRRNCGFNPCPINGGWSLWTQWSTPQCPALCGSGVMATVIRQRTCTNPSPSFGGNSCQGSFQETELKTCGLSPCDGEVNGGFGPWNAWTVSPCSATCGRNVTRMLSRQRLCNNPAPANGGRDCIGPRNDTSNQLCSVPECQGCPEATIYFVVDQSESVGTANFQLLKAALNSFVSSIISRNNNIRVGVIGFSSNVTSFIRDTSDISSLQAAINFTLTPPNGGTNTHLGIRTATQYLNQGTSNYPKVMVVITDGLSNLPNETRVAAAEARNSGITVFAVGVNAFNIPSIRQRFQAELLSIASSNATAIESANFNVLTNSLNNISQILCRGTVNGNWGSWGPWSVTRCSGTCGTSIVGTSNRTRTCTDPAPFLNGNSCVGNSIEVIRRNCGFNPCPINGGWSLWTQWSTPQCPALCGSGVMATVIRQRTCTNPSPSFGGNSCQGSFQETELKTCGLSPCDGEVNGGFGPWNAWTVSPCSATCGRNVTRMLSRQRLCNNPAPANGGRDCIGPRNDTSNQLCSVPECQGCPEATIYFVVDQSESVGTANFQLLKAALNSFVSSIISRNNNIRVGVIGFSSNVTSFIRDTSDISSLQASINFTLTPPNGGTNTHLGIRTATQYLNQGTSNYPKVMVVITDGLSNFPNETRVAAAEARNSGITVFAVGVNAFNIPSIRQRFQAELLSIASSNATAIESANFNVLTNSLNNISQILCRGTVNGNWGSWGPWSVTRCSGTCGTSIVGTSNRTRTCTDPAPFLNGNSCVGNSIEVIRRNCGFNPCPINGGWSLWTQWSTPQCPALCGSGVMATVIRQRTCTNPSPSFGGNSCQGSFQETELKTCGLSPCDGEVNGGFGPWNAWTVSPCSATCGRNVTRMLSRQRLCNNPAPANGGRDCIGPRNDTSNQLCSVPECQGCPEATIYFVVDQSESVGTADFQLLKAALNSFVSSIISRNNNIRVGVIGFSSNVTSFIRDTSDISSLQASINFTLTPPNGGTNTHLGIRTATQYLNQGASNYPKVMVVITDGLSNLPNETRVAAAEARNSGITVFAVGVNALNIPSIRQRFQAELLSIASSSATAIESANFNVLTNSLNNISQILCRGTVTALCDDVKKQYGVGYRYHPTDCDKYIQCYDNPRGIAIGVYRSCPFGYYWNQDTLRCTESWKVDCPLERCKGSCGASYKMAGSCRSYWKCDEGKSVARCCPRGFSFSPGDGCYFNLYCDDECPSPYVSRDVCDKHPNWGNANSYNISLGDLGWRSMSCPANSFFNILDCGCTQVSPATCAASYDFMAGTRPSWVLLEQVNNQVGALSLTNKSKVHLDIKMTVADSPIVFTFTYRETVVSNKSRVLASSKDRLVVSTEPKGVLFTITSWYGEVTRMTLSTDGMPLNQWKTVSVMYTCKYLVGTVSTNNVKYMDRVLVKDTNILSDGLTIGSDASRVPGMPFVGDVGRVSVYKCDPGILV